MIAIFATSRCIRDFYTKFYDVDMLLPKAISISEFLSNAVVVNNKSLADNDTRVLLMREAAKFDSFKALHVDIEFMSFIKNSTYLFRFFEELSVEMVKIEDLKLSDIYVEFEEHLDILDILLQKYTLLLNEQNLFDKITLPSLYEVNDEYLKNKNGFIYHLEGFLNKFELSLFLKIAQICPFKLSLHVNEFNEKMIGLFEQYNINLEIGHAYTLNLSTLCIEEKHILEEPKFSYDIRSFSTRVLQNSYVHEKINEFVQAGIAPEDIAVIVPDEEFAVSLKAFDNYKNLNFAMGVSYTQNILYEKLDTLDKYLRLQEIKYKYKLNRLKIEDNIVEDFKKSWNKKIDTENIVKFLRTFCDEEKQDEIFEEEIFKFTSLLKNLKIFELQKAMKLFLNRLSARSSDDVLGGKVTVMGLLESRGVSFEGVIVVDFSDEFVPKRSNKDMFLSSQIRAHANLPSKYDRENLQRYFYRSLFYRAKKVAISYVKNEQSMASRFLDELGLKIKGHTDEVSYFNPLFKRHKLNAFYNPEIIDTSYDIKSGSLSSSKLKTLLTCKRQFYFKYILHSKETHIPDNSVNAADIGNKLHEALFYVLKNLSVVEENILMIELRRYLQSQKESLLMHYHMDIWILYLQKFAKLEAKRYQNGYRVLELEKSYQTKYNGFSLEGKIDRIDIRVNKLSIIDYKSGKIPTTTLRTLEKTTDFQLEFYYLLTKDKNEIDDLYYYDLKKSKLVKETFFTEKLEKLDKVLKELEKPITDFEMCESNAPCKYCAYSKLCQRNLI